VKSINRKLNAIEGKVLQKPKIGSTMICSCAWPEPEQTLLEQARQLSQMEIPFEEATEAQKAILEKAGEIFLRHFCSL
jgi:hypothetical protein